MKSSLSHHLCCDSLTLRTPGDNPEGAGEWPVRSFIKGCIQQLNNFFNWLKKQTHPDISKDTSSNPLTLDF